MTALLTNLGIQNMIIRNLVALYIIENVIDSSVILSVRNYAVLNYNCAIRVRKLSDFDL